MKLINKVVTSIILLVSFIYLVIYIKEKNIAEILTCISVIPILLVLKLLKNNINEYIKFIYLIYVFLLLVLGAIMNLYKIFYYYDSITHFIFGFLSSIIALLILKVFNKYDKKNYIFNIIFMISITLAFASIWEIFEFNNSIIFNMDVQKVLTSGVADTMKDIILSFLASILFAGWYLYNIKTKSKTIDYLLEKST